MSGGATLVREVGQGRNPAALSDFECVLFFYCLNPNRIDYSCFQEIFCNQSFSFVIVKKHSKRLKI